jgi:hypothetical protein
MDRKFIWKLWIRPNIPTKRVNEYNAFACWPLLAFEMKNMSNDKKINSGLYERLLRASYEPLLLGDNSLIKSLGFEPKYQIKETLQTVYADWV